MDCDIPLDRRDCLSVQIRPVLLDRLKRLKGFAKVVASYYTGHLTIALQSVLPIMHSPALVIMPWVWLPLFQVIASHLGY